MLVKVRELYDLLIQIMINEFLLSYYFSWWNFYLLLHVIEEVNFVTTSHLNMNALRFFMNIDKFGD